jgi:catechol 2,3-dioxygenase-like lactoylglutathione lyase family enzyme
MAKLRHIAIMVPNPEATAKFFMQTFGMEQVGTTESPLSTGIFLSDGTINLAVLNFKDDKAAGVDGGKDSICINHMGFWVDDLEEIDKKIKDNGGKLMLGLPEDPEDRKELFYEVKYKNPDGIIVDVSAHGWIGAKL